MRLSKRLRLFSELRELDKEVKGALEYRRRLEEEAARAPDSLRRQGAPPLAEEKFRKKGALSTLVACLFRPAELQQVGGRLRLRPGAGHQPPREEVRVRRHGGAPRRRLRHGGGHAVPGGLAPREVRHLLRGPVMGHGTGPRRQPGQPGAIGLPPAFSSPASVGAPGRSRRGRRRGRSPPLLLQETLDLRNACQAPSTGGMGRG